MQQSFEDLRRRLNKAEAELVEQSEKAKKEHTLKLNLDRNFDELVIAHKQLKNVKYEQEDTISMLQNELERCKTRLQSEESEKEQLKHRLASANDR